MLATLLLCFLTSVAHAEPIKFLGVDMTMTKRHMISKVEDQFPKMKCADYLDGEMHMCKDTDASKGRRESSAVYIFLDGKLESPELVVFSCDLYNGCAYKVAELIKIFAKKFEILFAKSEKVGTYAVQRSMINGWCAKGEAGDKICVDGNHDDELVRYVYLSRSALGRKLKF